MGQNAPGKSHREGIGLIELAEMFPDEAAATKWFDAGLLRGRLVARTFTFHGYISGIADDMRPV